MDNDTVRHLAKSILSCALLSVCSQYSQLGLWKLDNYKYDNNLSGVRWASIVILLAAGYYMQFQIWSRFWQHKRRGYTRTINPQPQSSVDMDVDVDIDPIEQVWASNVVHLPELTMSSVWTYVYGWGLLLFVCIYCLAGQDVSSSCWWVVGMIALSFNELISRPIGKWMICIVLCLCAAVFSIWAGAFVSNLSNVNYLMDEKYGSFLGFVMGVAFPVSTPFIFFTIRSTVRSGTKDVTKLCEFALPFMAVLAASCLLSEMGRGIDKIEGIDQMEGIDKIEGFDKTGRRTFNSSDMVETVAKFSYPNLGHNKLPDGVSGVTRLTLILVAPLVAYWLLRVLIVAILTGHSTEFITGFLLVTSARYGMTHPFDSWSVLGVSWAGAAFVLLLAGRRS